MFVIFSLRISGTFSKRPKNNPRKFLHCIRLCIYIVGVHIVARFSNVFLLPWVWPKGAHKFYGNPNDLRFYEKLLYRAFPLSARTQPLDNCLKLEYRKVTSYYGTKVPIYVSIYILYPHINTLPSQTYF